MVSQPKQSNLWWCGVYSFAEHARVPCGIINEEAACGVACLPNVRASGEHIESIAKKNDFATAHTVYGKFDINELEKFLSSKDSELYFPCPALFKSLSKKWSVPAAQLHYEYFGPTQDIDA
ncbi:hypothetical protein GQ600_6809 [Phytophthora cactorum]|nr:hypothetical protein GQ600_6809 [Phytophthora cactorum]